MNLARLTIATVVIACMAVTTLARKPESAPVRVSFAVPKDMKTGEEVETAIAFRALEDIQQLDVHVAPSAGLELLSDVHDAVFTNVRRGTAPVLSVRIRLIDPKWGSLSVTYRARTAVDTTSGAIGIVYGSPK